MKCQVCGHEEKLEQCPKCERYTCEDCMKVTTEQLGSRKCLYCGRAETEFTPKRETIGEERDRLIAEKVKALESRNTTPIIPMCIRFPDNTKYDIHELRIIYDRNDVGLGSRRMIPSPTEVHGEIVIYDKNDVSLNSVLWSKTGKFSVYKDGNLVAESCMITESRSSIGEIGKIELSFRGFPPREYKFPKSSKVSYVEVGL